VIANTIIITNIAIIIKMKIERGYAE